MMAQQVHSCLEEKKPSPVAMAQQVHSRIKSRPWGTILGDQYDG
jgi:hypothetical protein